SGYAVGFPAVAGNPTAYPDLLDWLANLNDPAVDAALAARSEAETGPVPTPVPQQAPPQTAQQPAADATAVQPPVGQAAAPQGQPAPAKAAYGAESGAPVTTGWNFRGLGKNDLL